MDLCCAGKLEAALECFLSSHSAHPTHARTLGNLTLTYLSLGMDMEALGMANKVRLVSALLASVRHAN